LANISGRSIRTVQTWLELLLKLNFISVEIKNMNERHICIVNTNNVDRVDRAENEGGGMKKTSWGYEENFMGV
jgi:hypothetical protein